MAGAQEPGHALPLSGRTIVVTRAAEQAPALAEALEALGAEVLSLPVIELAEPSDWGPADEAIDTIASYDWIVLTSANGVDRLDARMRAHGLRLEDLGDASVAVVGKATAERLRGYGLAPAVTPERFRAEDLVDAMREAHVGPGARVLLARAEEAREVLPDELRALGAVVDVVPMYRLLTATPPADVLARVAGGGVDAVVFASGGTARRFLEVLQRAGIDRGALAGAALASIGPVTTEAMAGLGLHADVEALDATASSLVAALVERLARR